MNILIVSGDFFPNNSPRSFRTTELVKELANRGNEVTLYIPKVDFDYSEFIKKYPISIKFFERTLERRKIVGISIVDRIIFRVLQNFSRFIQQ